MNSNILHIQVDTETMSNKPDAAIVQLAAVVFDSHQVYPDLSFNECIAPEDARLYGRVSTYTMAWWNTQNPEIRAKVFGGSRKLTPVLDEFLVWIERTKQAQGCTSVNFWCFGAGFDDKIIENAIEATELKTYVPWNYRDIRCARTAIALLSDRQRSYVGPNTSSHDALADAIWQARLCSLFLARLAEVMT
jgi:hypothetical protein